MLWYCEYTWYPGVNADQVRQRVVQQHEAGTNHPDQIRGWYDLVGGGAGFLLVETNDTAQLNLMLTPYMDLMSFDVRAVTENKYDETVNRLRSG